MGRTICMGATMARVKVNDIYNPQLRFCRFHNNWVSSGPWGGHRLTGQYERMWHVIYGHKPDQVFCPLFYLSCINMCLISANASS